MIPSHSPGSSETSSSATCSKWNPTEHRLFSHISMNRAGEPLRSFELMPRLHRGHDG
ncbi:ISAzo13-like element transposase-related protein [Azohydromonas caseinilytica]|uniref:Uncharacterized protein n=1 Tax=Azohydromonas caseinilytica TaxID=2728836 RepID=A0A848FFX2_9BURK|nr:hypothetical protein [Azohydromonas caseinilytica]